MEQEFTAGKISEASLIATKGIKVVFLALVWIPFLGSTYLTITHLTAWLKTGFWPSYSTANLISALRISQPRGIGSGIQPTIDWVMLQPATYSLMALAILFSVTMALIVDD